MISVIIPVYNQEKYLVRVDACLQRQTYRDFEVIYVNDGSTDGSADILEQLAKDKENYIIVHKENGGLSSARNAGIRRAQGKWVTFIDSDDTVTDDYLETLFSHISDDVDLVMGGVAMVDENEELKEPLFPQDEGSLSVTEAMIWYYKPKYFFGGCAWGKLYRTGLLVDRSLLFDDQKRFAEDILFGIQYLANMDRGIYFTTKPIYRYNVGNPHSIMHQISVDNLITELDSYIRMCKIVLSAHTGSMECVMRACMDTYIKYRCLLRRLDKEKVKSRYAEYIKNVKRTVQRTLGGYWIYCWFLWQTRFKYQ